MTDKVLAATLTEPGVFEVRDYEMPGIAADAGLLRMEQAGICGSDVHGMLQMRAGQRIMGHENVGYIDKIGREAAARWGVREGDRVALEEYIPCGYCKWCRTGHHRFCNQTEYVVDGFTRRSGYGHLPVSDAPGLWGGFSQYLYLDPRAVLHRMPERVPADEAPLFLALANGVEWAERYGGASPGKTVLIQGPGQMGLASVLASKSAGAACIMISGLSRDRERLELAKRFGADFTINVEEEDLRERVAEITGGEGADIIVNVTGGGKGTMDEAMDTASKFSTIVLAAAGNQQISTVQHRKDIVVKWAHGHSYEAVERGIQMLASGDVDFSGFSTHEFSLNDVAMAIKSVGGEGAPGAIHVRVNPWA